MAFHFSMANEPKANIYFCQSPRDIAFILQQVADDIDFSKEIIIVGSRLIFEYVSQLEIPLARIKFIPRYRFTLTGIAKSFFTNWHFYIVHVRGKAYEKCFFCSHYFDFTTMFLLRKILVRHVTYLDHFDCQREKVVSHSTKQRFYIWLMKLLYGLDSFFSEPSSIPTFSLNFRMIEICHPKLVTNKIKRFLFRIKDMPKAALILDSNDANMFGLDNYESIVTQAVTALKRKGWAVFVKGHPQYGVSPVFRNLKISELNQGIPAELLDLESTKILLSSHSAALAIHPEDDELVRICMLDLLQYSSSIQKQDLKTHLIKISNDRILFPSNIGELESLV